MPFHFSIPGAISPRERRSLSVHQSSLTSILIAPILEIPLNERNDERKGKRTKREKTILKERIEESGAAASLTKIVVLRAFSYGKRSFHAFSRTLLSQISPFQRERKGKLPFLSSTTRFTILSFHASSPRAEKRLWGLADRSAPAQIKLSRHRIFNGRSLMYEGERINVSIELHRV